MNATLSRFIPEILTRPAAIEMAEGTLLDVDHLAVAYGNSVIIRDLSLTAREGEVVCIMGRNGAGKTTLLKAIMGVLPVRGGRIAFNGRDVTVRPSYTRARGGMGYVPQGRGIFPYLSVLENLLMGTESGNARDARERLEYVYELFPVVKQMARRTAGVLSGGQQQQLAIGRALMGRPTLLLLDEPTEGIQPNIVEQIEDVIRQLKGQITIVLVEQFLGFALSNADQCYVLERGAVTLSGRPSELDVARVEDALAV